jgi:hypothetical protein
LHLLAEYIAKGVIAQACKLTSDDVASDLEDWKKAADVVISSLGFGTDISDVQQQRVFHYYVPVFMWARKQMNQHKQQADAGPLVVCPRSSPQMNSMHTPLASGELLLVAFCVCSLCWLGPRRRLVRCSGGISPSSLVAGTLRKFSIGLCRSNLHTMQPSGCMSRRLYL